MVEGESSQSFSEIVTQQLPPDVRELRAPMADHFDSGLSEAVKIYLDAVRDQLESNVRSLLDQFEES